MIRKYLWALAAVAAGVGHVAAQSPPAVSSDGRLYELRTYYAAPGKIDSLHARFRDHTRPLMEKHGVTCHGFWAPSDSEPDRVVALVSYPSADARQAAWAGFATDPAWLQVKRRTERYGRLVERIDDLPLTGTLTATGNAAGQRVFEIKLVRAGEAAEFDGERVGSWVPARPEKGVAQVVLVARRKVTARGQAPDARFVSAVTAVAPPGDNRPRLLEATDYSPIK